MSNFDKVRVFMKTFGQEVKNKSGFPNKAIVRKKPSIENLWINPPVIGSSLKKLVLWWAADFNPTIFFPVINCNITSKLTNKDNAEKE